mmetsp:Transcript_17559/g.22982  ORF Transcript_17559/g.22982 Transcript_17559/m.22982 type:complete len:317 (-) Transcript_17559:1404-2354(-)|eukprot:CAMPEP_0184025600 /NCGR_PEP_ID=MMETSP0954-20121128/12931_1 /TAXON_ID=627963 /ORGANISM="Aplanochytrium sp, Strain PBS07" /LENGTH=316 /DNA_ID=CAMNT_0026309463 /DNA_START=1968 /DNA_END=2918 /DNA_ORIENTATION=+
MIATQENTTPDCPVPGTKTPKVEHKKGNFKNQQGLNLVTYSWTVPEPKAAVFCIHGYGSFALWEFGTFPDCGYEKSLIQTLNKEGYNVYSFDMQGFGESEGHHGLRASLDKFDHYVDDAVDLYKEFKEESKLPLYVLGQSLGGCISSHVAIRLGKELPGVILFAPMLSLEENKKKNWLLLPFLGLASQFLPNLPIGDKSPNIHYPDMQKRFFEHELSYNGKLRARLGYEFLAAVDRARENAHKVESPILLLHSERDTMCEPDGSKYFYEKVSSTKKKLVLFDAEADDLWHALTVEPDNHKTFVHVKEFLQEHTSSN